MAYAFCACVDIFLSRTLFSVADVSEYLRSLTVPYRFFQKCGILTSSKAGSFPYVFSHARE